MARKIPGSLREIRGWKRRVDAALRKLGGIFEDMMQAVGPEHEECGENFTSQADEAVAATEALAGYIETCIRTRKARK